MVSTRILITGCSGFLASHLLPVLARKKEASLFGATEVEGFQWPGLEVHRCDIRHEEEVERLVKEVRPNLVFHFAAVTNVGFSWEHPRLTYEVNVIGTSNLLEALRRHADQARVVAMSSAEVYARSSHALGEEAPIAPRSPYSLSKRAMELLAALYGDSYHLPVVTIRAFNFTGPGQERRFVASDFAAQIAEIEKGKRDPVIRVGNLEAVRDFSDVRDIARYLDILARRGKPGQTYNLCSGAPRSIREVLDLLLSFSSSRIEVQVDPEKLRPLDNPMLAGDASRLRNEFGLTPKFSLEQTLKDLLDHWRRTI